jgi:alkylation response protein AidB-like acyl-CoA dehydrogenase
MNFTFNPAEEQLRTDVRAFLVEHFTDHVRAENAAGKRGEGWGEAIRDFFEKVNQKRWFAWSWPTEFGGGGGDSQTTGGGNSGGSGGSGVVILRYPSSRPSR